MYDFTERYNVLNAIKEDGHNLRIVDPIYQDDSLIVAAAVEQNKDAIKWASPRLQKQYNYDQKPVEEEKSSFSHRLFQVDAKDAEFNQLERMAIYGMLIIIGAIIGGAIGYFISGYIGGLIVGATVGASFLPIAFN